MSRLINLTVNSCQECPYMELEEGWIHSDSKFRCVHRENKSNYIVDFKYLNEHNQVFPPIPESCPLPKVS